MSMTAEEAWQEEAYDQMVREILASHREDIIDEFVSERMASYYRNHPDLTSATEAALDEARSLLTINPTASLVFSRSATEIVLRDVLLKPIASGMVHDEHAGSLLVELALRNNQFIQLLLTVLEDYGINLRKVVRDGSTNNLWAEIQEIAGIRNRILHRGEKASKEQAERSLAIAVILFERLYPYLRRQITQS